MQKLDEVGKFAEVGEDLRPSRVLTPAAFGNALRVLMALGGGALGSLLAWWSVRAFVASQPSTVPRIDQIGVDLRVLAFAMAVSLITGIVFGLQARSKASDAQAGHGTWDPSLENDGKRADTIAQSLLAVGGAAVVVGGVLYYFGRHDAPPRVGVAPRTGGAMVVWGCDL